MLRARAYLANDRRYDVHFTLAAYNMIHLLNILTPFYSVIFASSLLRVSILSTIELIALSIRTNNVDVLMISEERVFLLANLHSRTAKLRYDNLVASLHRGRNSLSITI